MKIVTTLRILMNKEFRPTLKKVMEKWPEAKDTFLFVKIARIIESEMKDYVDGLDDLREKLGYALEGGRKSITSAEITDSLLVRWGKFDATGRPALTNTTDASKACFFEQKVKADACILAYDAAVEKLLDEPFDLEIPRAILITEKHLRKEVLSAQDCFILEPILDLSQVMDESDEKESPEKE